MSASSGGSGTKWKGAGPRHSTTSPANSSSMRRTLIALCAAQPHPEGGRMDGFDPLTSFGPDVAAEYDDDLRGDEAAAADLLADLAGVGRALELAIGTGRIAVPLMDRGVEVDGIEQSRAMAERLWAKRPDAR